MPRSALLIGVLVLVVRLLTFPRTPWDADERQWLVAVSIIASVITAVVLAKEIDPIAALLFSFAAAVLVHGAAGRVDAVAWMCVALAVESSSRRVVESCLLAAAALLWLPVLLGLGNQPAPPINLVRLTLHPWGSKIVALPVLLCVAFGVGPLVRSYGLRAPSQLATRNPQPQLELLFWVAVAQIAFGIAFVDPADGARWAIPALMFMSAVAAMGLRALAVSGGRRSGGRSAGVLAGHIGAAVIAALSVWYAFPILRDRVTRPSPLIEATRAKRANDLLVDGNSNAPNARVFSRPDADAYGKLTRNAYRRVSLIPILPEEQFEPVRGVYGVERNEAGESWRWLEQEAEVRLPHGRRSVRVELRMPEGENEVRINGTTVRVRGTVAVDLPPADHLVFVAKRSFLLQPPDTRRVAVQLVRIVHR